MLAILNNTPGMRPDARFFNHADDIAALVAQAKAAGDEAAAERFGAMSPDAPPAGTRFVWPGEGFDADAQVIAEDGNSLRPRNAAELLEVARTARLADLKALRDAIQYDAFLYEGHWIDCDQTARANLTGLQLSVVSGADPFPYQWRSADNVWVPLADRVTWAALMEAFEAHAKKTWAAYAAHEGEIASSADPASHDIARDIEDSEWPQTRIDKGTF